MRDLVKEGYEIQKKFTSILKEEDIFVNISNEYLTLLHDTLVSDLEKNRSAYKVYGITPEVDGQTGRVYWPVKTDTGECLVYCSPFWENKPYISVEVYNEDGDWRIFYDILNSKHIVNKLTASLDADVKFVKKSWMAIVRISIDKVRQGDVP